MRMMKESHVEWIGKIPIDWDIVKGKYILKCLQKPIKEDDGVITCFRDGEVTLRSNRREEGFTLSDKEIGYQGIDVGDLVVHGMDGFAGAIGISDSRGKASPVLNVLDSFMDKKYLMYYLRSMAYGDVFLSIATGIRVRSCDLRWNKLAELPYPVPKVIEQKKISDFLDNKVKEIESLNLGIQKQIEKLEIYKQNKIGELLTKGDDETVEFQNTNICWIGMIPSDWKLTKLKYVLDEAMKYGASESGVDFDEALPRYIRITDITSDNKLKEDNKLSLTYEQSRGYILDDDTILFARSGGTVGKTFWYKKEYGKAAFAGYLISAVPDKTKIRVEWLYYFTLSNVYWEWANRIFTQATIQNIGADKYSNMPIVIPKLEIQDRIIKIIDSLCLEIDSTIDIMKTQMIHLDRYKKSLIYEYVTGKKEVPSNQ